MASDGRNRLSTFWTPTQTRKANAEDTSDHGHDLLLRAGFLRQAHSGIFHLLPLGLRVQDKIERLIDKHMQSVGASKVSLSSLSSQELWQRSGRLDGRNAELFHIEDRKEAGYLLAPTHEEEITMIVKNAVHSYKDLPLRLYQVSRKYRDEARPRQGLLRGREFVMKDLYTFDVNEAQALETYESVRAAYRAFLDELNLPYLVATADSGNMGGNHSHEYHFPSPKGEDTVISCASCRMTINEELFRGQYNPDHVDSRIDQNAQIPFQVWHGYKPVEKAPQRLREVAKSDDQEPTETSETEANVTAAPTIVEVFLPKGPFEPNIHAIKDLVPGIDTSQSSDIADLKQLLNKEAAQGMSNGHLQPERVTLLDPRLSVQSVESSAEYWAKHPLFTGLPGKIEKAPFLLTQARQDDPCPKCGAEGSLHFEKAVEIGHTFHLGRRYSKPLQATVMDEKSKQVEIEMGCHGIGVSRLIAAAASLIADDKGLNWPKVIAPFGVVLVGAGSTPKEDVVSVYDSLGALHESGLDVVIDDRQRPFGWKLNDADLIGFPFILVMGKAWNERRAVELQCRRLGLKEEIPVELVPSQIKDYSEKL
ncbi:hypothetical protein M409DRAFT_18156 [Zasmidium cellare ATCC 36951]|uniref:proline--tRNA ligase n=1 Tax=Zasmidium cellare ATCC 36951 TaxID=1080233 RepID=A0A6A6CY05_ZASCE|nr:uncharacterized protein M409DRAFT_18156 [Zasmidium cellare ATCC 36951]KAF2171925.1 hypothetical protein M409DRAFT_18156 [Zasmidium cellare ATCC 36951]